jgi:hypothetical protein
VNRQNRRSTRLRLGGRIVLQIGAAFEAIHAPGQLQIVAFAPRIGIYAVLQRRA